MSLATVLSRAAVGVEAPLVRVEVDLAGGLPHFAIVGLPETAVRESKDRVRAAISNSGFRFPMGRITVNLAPADLPKEGGRFDLPIAVGILAASGQVQTRRLDEFEFLGELALTGEVRAARGALPAGLRARDRGRALIAAEADAREAALVRGLHVLAADRLASVCQHFDGTAQLSVCEHQGGSGTPTGRGTPDLAQVRGQHRARRALEVAAAGFHNLLLVGPPGTGKTMLASRLPGILPGMSESEALETAALWSVSTHGFAPDRWRRRPFRAPHHTASGVALVGGGSRPRPGEASLAHNGVLFLDELPEFERRVLEVLREPLELGHIVVSRAARQARFPARFQLVGAMNPCPCGHLGDGTARCTCTLEQIARYQSRVSGPLLDRVDLHVETPPGVVAAKAPPAEGSALVRTRVEAAHDRQLARQGCPNALLAPLDAERLGRLGDAERELLGQAVERLGLSARGNERVLRVALTVADLAGASRIETAHLTEALSYRTLDRRLR